MNPTPSQPNPMNSMHTILRQDPEIWRLFTAEEEYEAPFTDMYDRYPYYLSKNRDIFHPKASEYLYNQGFQMEFPDDQPFAVCLTHDIDAVYQSISAKGFYSLKSLLQGDLKKSVATALSTRSRKLPYWNFKEIMALEERYGSKSSFYFMALAPGDQDYAYDIRDLKDEIRMIADAGWEVGLHGGHRAYCDPAQLTVEKTRLEEALGQPVTGYRNHFLRFRTPDTWEQLSQAGFSYDATFGYADCVGFRNGMCHPFRPYDLRADHEIGILEIPLTVMDCTLDAYMRLDPRKAWEVTRRLIDTVEQYRGVFTLLWHNTYMDGERLKLYEKVLAYCREKGAWMTSGEEVRALLVDESYKRIQG